MTQCNTLNLQLSNSQFNKLKYAIKNGTEVTLNLMMKLLLTNKQISKICKAFENGLSAYIKFSKTQLYKFI